MDSADEDPAGLLEEGAQWTEPWGASEDGSPCEKCGGAGATRYCCWSCLLAELDPRCPACGGRVRWTDRCPVCRGGGTVDGRPRHGVSAFPRPEGLYHYMTSKGADLDGCVIVELDAELAQDVDFDADHGALLVLPRTIRASVPVDPDRARRLSA